MTLRNIGSLIFVGAASSAIAAAPLASAQPAPPPPPPPPACVNADGTPCYVGPDGAAGVIPGGPGGQADAGGASGYIPGGPSGAAGPGGVSGCIPGIGCASIPAP
ncbi:hypothetical protein JDV09_24195 [Mycobacterium sp. Y57]|uniref:hypothetical protein n=1 Tax=Mycolicibacterium xanthum TaxID=2796469 RepID=UPI001C848900|nr:hypothetical protein [Mycolicibacterium xanthum]MBX7435176.1 hypothetical protein [Mycolicibacterium xanthum]